jgi:hypothetical protein
MKMLAVAEKSETVMPPYPLIHYPQFQLSAVSIIRDSARPEKIGKLKK